MRGVEEGMKQLGVHSRTTTRSRMSKMMEPRKPGGRDGLKVGQGAMASDQ